MIFLLHNRTNQYITKIMTLIPYILIAIPTCLLAIAVWTYFDYRKYKKKNSLILLLFLFYPMLLHAQYTDRNHCSIAFTSHKNQPGTLEQVKDNMIFQFIPNNDFWKIIIKNNNFLFFQCYIFSHCCHKNLHYNKLYFL